MKFLVTGVRGFVAQHLIDVLKSAGHEVFPSMLDQTKVEGLRLPFEINEFDGVFNLAGKTHPPTSFLFPPEYFAANAIGTINLVHTMSELNPNAVLMQCSTPEVYGVYPEGTEITEDFPLKPMNPYGVGKAAADLYILERARNGKLKAFLTRATSHTGPGRPSNYSISSDAIQIARILNGKQEKKIMVGNLESMRAVLDVRDVARGYYMLLLSFLKGKISNGAVFNISYGEPKKMGFYLATMLKAYNLKADIITDPALFRPIDIPYQKLSGEKMCNATGWKPEIPIEKTLTDLVEYWREKV